MHLSVFPARDGDCFILRWGSANAPRRMLIDCGRESTWAHVKGYTADLTEARRKFDALVITHIDADHIAGVVKMLDDDERPLSFKDVWFNAYHHLVSGDWETYGVEQGEQVSLALRKAKAPWNEVFDAGAIVLPDEGDLPRVKLGKLNLTFVSPTGAKLTKLAGEWKTWIKNEGVAKGYTLKASPPPPSGIEYFGAKPNVEKLAKEPDQADGAAPNGSSIAFIAEEGGKRCLFGADAHPDVLEASLAALPEEERRFDLVKLAHHGSHNNISVPLLKLLDCKKFLISTDGARHGHPDPETIAKILKNVSGQKTLYFNYRQPKTEMWENDALQDEYKYRCVFPKKNDEPGRLEIAI